MYVLSVMWLWRPALVGVMMALAWVVWRCVRRPDAGPVSCLVAFMAAAGFVIVGDLLTLTLLNLF